MRFQCSLAWIRNLPSFSASISAPHPRVDSRQSSMHAAVRRMRVTRPEQRSPCSVRASSLRTIRAQTRGPALLRCQPRGPYRHVMYPIGRGRWGTKSGLFTIRMQSGSRRLKTSRNASFPTRGLAIGTTWSGGRPAAEGRFSSSAHIVVNAAPRL